MAHEGWKNAETWAVALDIDNDQADLTYWLEQAADHRRRSRMFKHETWTPEQDERFGLADDLKDEFDTLAESECAHLLIHSLCQIALGNVDWNEIAVHLLAKLTEQESIGAPSA